MKVKKFVAPTMPEAMKMIRNELGQDAVILNSKVVQKGGFFGLFAKKNIEVIAAVDPQPLPKKQPVPKEKQPAPLPKNQVAIEKVLETPKQDKELLKEIQALKTMMQGLSHHDGGRDSIEEFPGPLKEINHYLMDQEVDSSIRKGIMSHLLEKWYLNHAAAAPSQIKEWAKDYITELLSPLSFGAIDYSKKYINVVGPTGVGKTTTLAKIAAHAVLKYQKKVAFITTDTYRIAAIDQLKTYAEILNVPLEVTYTIDDFKSAKEKYANYDLILIDTAGRNFRNKQYVEELKNVIDFDDQLETILVLALTSKYSDMIDIVDQFSIIKINKLIFTKVDETSRYGSMLNLISKYKIGVAYLTNGQNVPDDIVEASPKSIVNIFFGVNKHEGSS